MTLLRDLFKVKKTQIEMMKDRGYDISVEEPVISGEFELVDFIKFYGLNVIEEYKYGELLSDIYIHNITKTKYIILYSVTRTKIHLAKAEIDNFSHQIDSHDCSGGILISTNPASSSANSILASLIYRKKIQHYLIRELVYNPTKHSLVPKHYVLNNEEKLNFLKENKNVSISQLPIIRVKNLHLTECWNKDTPAHGSCGDPIAKYYAMDVDQIVQITRDNFAETLIVDTYNIFRRVDNV